MPTEARKQLNKAHKDRYENGLAAQIERFLRVPGLKWERQYRFLPERRYRADFAELTHRLLVECQGSVYSRGRHTRGVGYTMDCIRMAEASIAGYAMIYVTSEMVEDGRALALLDRWFKARK